MSENEAEVVQKSPRVSICFCCIVKQESYFVFFTIFSILFQILTVIVYTLLFQKEQIQFVYFIFVIFFSVIFILMGLACLILYKKKGTYGHNLAIMYGLSTSAFLILNFFLWVAKLILFFVYDVCILTLIEHNSDLDQDLGYYLKEFGLIFLIKLPIWAGLIYMFVLYFAIIQKRFKDDLEEEISDADLAEEKPQFGDTVDIKDIYQSYSDLGKQIVKERN